MIQTKQQPEKKGVPYEELSADKIASRNDVRLMASRRGRETIMYPFDKIKRREGFNTRKVYNGIPELAESIKANGLVTALTVDILKSGDALVEIGNRRWHALGLLWEEGWLQTAEMPGIYRGSVEVFRNDKETSEIDRIKRILSSNHAEPLTAYEIAETIDRLKNYFSLKPKEIAAIVGYSRQQVENMLILANEPAEVKEAVAAGVLKPTTAIALARTAATDEEKVTLVTEAKEKGRVIKLSDLPAELQEEVTENDKQEESDFSDKAEMHTVIPYDSEPEEKSRTTNARPPSQQSQEAHDKLLNTMKDEEVFCTETIQMLDKITLLVEKIPGAAGDDVRRLLPGCIQRIQSVREYVKKVRD